MNHFHVLTGNVSWEVWFVWSLSKHNFHYLPPLNDEKFTKETHLQVVFVYTMIDFHLFLFVCAARVICLPDINLEVCFRCWLEYEENMHPYFWPPLLCVTQSSNFCFIPLYSLKSQNSILRKTQKMNNID